jgi:hypothetical protein
VSDTVLERPLVKMYLRALDAACATLPIAQARELHELIAAHLEEALPPGASIDEVRAELDRLGTPHSLAKDAAGPAPAPALRRLGNRLRRVRWWTWTAIAVLVAAIGTGAGFLISVNTAAPLYASGVIGWLYPVDQAAAVQTRAGAVTQTAVPYRFGQRQGILVTLNNDSDWTQQITGTSPTWSFGAALGESQVSVQDGPDLCALSDPAPVCSHYTSPGAIPPHSSRLVRVFWTSDECMGAGGGIGIDSITLQVRVGGITRTEGIPLQDAFELTGPKHSIIRNCR